MTEHIPSRLNIIEIDGVPSTWPYKLLVSNGSLTDNGDGTATLSVSTGTGGGSVNIPQLDADPGSPAAESAWVLKAGGAGRTGGGKLRSFLGLSFPYLSVGTGSSPTYQFSYMTKESTIKRVALT